ncbi:hypothetical protein BS78_05G152000 [Paspalum vaginatum]|nr:hypothetical protein BS78_05G152000 [Paspalum vaginatum]
MAARGACLRRLLRRPRCLLPPPALQPAWPAPPGQPAPRPLAAAQPRHCLLATAEHPPVAAAELRPLASSPHCLEPSVLSLVLGVAPLGRGCLLSDRSCALAPATRAPGSAMRAAPGRRAAAAEQIQAGG